MTDKQTAVQFLIQQYTMNGGIIGAQDIEKAAQMEYEDLWHSYEMGFVDTEFRPQTFLEEVYDLKG